MPTALLVEDDADLRHALAQALESEGYTVHQAANGQEGLAAVKQQRPDVILLDLLMPVMSGEEMMHEIEQLPDGTKIPVLVLTNLAMGDTQVKQISRNQPTWYLVKADWPLKDIVAKVNALVKIAR